jgi:hypothetical protein
MLGEEDGLQGVEDEKNGDEDSCRPLVRLERRVIDIY